MRRLLETAAVLSCLLAGSSLGGGGAALAAKVTAALPATSSFGLPEAGAESHEGLPQWRRVLRSLAAEEPAYAACEAGGACPSRAVREWLALLDRLEREPRAAQLRAVNRFVNRWAYRSDQDAYGRRDHWATPLQFLAGSGDCEDYAITKYVSLRRLGIPSDDLRMVVLQDTSRDIAHAVLVARLEGGGSTWVVLDNLSDALEPPERLPHYVPYYSVNEKARWAHLGPDAAVPAGQGLPAREPATRPGTQRRN